MNRLIFALTLFSSAIAFSEPKVAGECKKNAALFAEDAASGGYDEDGFWAYDCFLAENKKVVICDVGASKGDGAAIDTYRVVLNKTCSKAFRVEMIGEE